MAESKSISIIYEGEIQKGRAHGFGRVINVEKMNSHIGYFQNGLKYGLGIELDKRGIVVE